MKKSFDIQELLHCKSKRHGTKPMQPSSLSRAFQRHQEHDLKHPCLVDLITTIQYKTKQNKLPSFIDRWDTYALVLLADGRFYKWLNRFDMSHESAQCALDKKVLEIKQMGSSSMDFLLLRNIVRNWCPRQSRN